MWDGIGGMRARDGGAGPRPITTMMTAMMRRLDRLARPLRRLLGRDLGVGGGLARTGIGITDIEALLDPGIGLLTVYFRLLRIKTIEKT